MSNNSLISKPEEKTRKLVHNQQQLLRDKAQIIPMDFSNAGEMLKKQSGVI